LAGAAFVSGGLLLTSVANSIWMGYATYGIGFGAGAACVYVPMLAAIGGWFERQRTAALGLAATGIATGTMIASPLSAALIERIGFRETYAVYAVVVLVVIVVCAMVVERAPSRAGAHVVRGGAFAAARELARDPAFARLYVSGVIMSMVVFVPLVFLTGYASEHGAGNVEAASVLGLLGACSIFGRLGVGFVAARVPLLVMYRTSFVAIAGALLLWLSADGQAPLLWAFAVVYGVAYGSWVAMLPAVSSQLFGSERLGVTLGIVFTGGAIGSVTGLPLAGATIDVTGNYESAIALAFVLAVSAWLTVRPIGSPERAAEPIAQPA
jgi:predicted MFS family arabinose efflux permease